MRPNFAAFLAALAAALLAASVASADVFNMQGGQTSLTFVTVGNAGNAPDTTGLGSVGYTYSIGKYDVTAAQYTAFLNAVATTSDPDGLYNANMATGYAACGISQAGGPGSYTYSAANGNFPVNYINWGDAARFCNWLQNGQPTGPEGNGTTETGAYTLNWATSDAALAAVIRNPNAVYCLPTENEWYKAAYYDPTLNSGAGGYWAYPTKSNTAPSAVAPATPGGTVLSSNSANYDFVASTNLTAVGTYVNSPGPYGTFDQGGLLFQWTDTPFTEPWGAGFDLANSSFESASSELKSSNTIYSWSPGSSQYEFTGFRVAETPEPSTVCLLVTGAGVLLAMTRWRNRRQMGR
jgi:formylglycine-generating enzyme required for sulfatase activity